MQGSGNQRRRARALALTASIAILAGGVAIFACTDEDELVATATQPLAPTPYAVFADAASVAKYADKCGLGTGAAALKLPALGTKDAPIRSTTKAADIKKEDNGWKLIQMFEASPTCLKSLPDLRANLWYKSAGGRDWYYLYRFTDPDPTKSQYTANGILGFDETSICSFDRTTTDFPPASLADLFFAGQTNDWDNKMDDCSDCHIHGYNAPREKTYIVAKGKTAKYDWLPAKWITPWKKYAAAFGPEWKLGQEPPAATPMLPKLPWVSGQGTELKTVPKPCSGCHGGKWVKPRKTTRYCEKVFEAAFDDNGSMYKGEQQFENKTQCEDFVTSIGCDKTKVCKAGRYMAALSPPMENEGGVRIASATLVSPSLVRVVPMQNPGIVWTAAGISASGDPWVTSLQVWGARYVGAPVDTAPMSADYPVLNPDMLPNLDVSGLSPGTYVVQLQVSDSDGTVSYSPRSFVTVPGSPPFDAGVDGPVIDAPPDVIIDAPADVMRDGPINTPLDAPAAGCEAACHGPLR